MSLPKDSSTRKALPLYSFLTGYFPDALLELVKASVAGNVQHNPGQPLRWDRSKSPDHLNSAQRHMFDHGAGNVYDDEPPEVMAAIGAEEGDSTLHLAKAAWHLLAQIQIIVEERTSTRRQAATQAVDGTLPLSAFADRTDGTSKAF